MPRINRRHLLTLLAASGAAAALRVKANALEGSWPRPDPDDADRWLYLRAAEVVFLIAATDRIIPEDDYPSASQVGAVDFIDLQLASPWGAGEGMYLEGPFHAETAVPGQGYQLRYPPAELYRRAIEGLQSALDRLFQDLPPEQQDQILSMLEDGKADAGPIPGKTFFTMLRRNTVEGYFTDPIHGGNRDMAGWRMIGFPGAHAYYVDLVGRHGLEYLRPPAGITYPAGAAAPRPVPPARNGGRN